MFPGADFTKGEPVESGCRRNPGDLPRVLESGEMLAVDVRSPRRISSWGFLRRSSARRARQAVAAVFYDITN
jgi:hypothetical protein